MSPNSLPSSVFSVTVVVLVVLLANGDGGGGGGVYAVQPLHASAEFRGREKTREERWHLAFGTGADAEPRARADNLVRLLLRIEQRYLAHCVTVVAYDEWLEANADGGHVLRAFLRGLQRPYMHGRVNTTTWRLANGELLLRSAKMVRGLMRLFTAEVCLVRLLSILHNYSMNNSLTQCRVL